MLKISKALGRQTTPPPPPSLSRSITAGGCVTGQAKRGILWLFCAFWGREAILAKFFWRKIGANVG